MAVDPLDPWTWSARAHDGPHGRMAYVERPGPGPAVVFVHGLPTAKELFYGVLARLDPALRIVAVDLLGYGASSQPRRRIHHREQAAAIDALRQHLGIDRYTLVAHDLGASVAVDVLRDHAASVERLVLISAPVYPDFREPAIVRLLRVPAVGPALLRVGAWVLFRGALARGLARPARLDRRLADALFRPYRGSAGRSALRRNLWWGRPADVFSDYPVILRRIAVPTLILHGCADPYIPIEHAGRLHRDVAGSTLRMIADGSHFLPIDSPEALAGALADFFAAAPIAGADPPLTGAAPR
ncbi:MAG: alpha/beta fold hydrolase [Nannocystaceae bacterium]